MEEGVARRRRPSSPADHPPVNDDLLSEILVRLPPKPSSLPRASLVCKRWRRLVSDPAFLRRFRAHHRNPPVVGILQSRHSGVTFIPTLDPPDRIPTERFSLRLDGPGHWDILSARHGRVLLGNVKLHKLLVWDPVTGDQRLVAVPLEVSKRLHYNGSVLCATTEQGHVHGDCHSSPFRVVLISEPTRETPALVFAIYSSETGIWSDIISIVLPLEASIARRSILLGDSLLYWFFEGILAGGILELDLDRQSLSVIDVPAEVLANSYHNSLFKLPEDDGLGMLVMSRSLSTGQVWERKVDCEGVAVWVSGKTIELDKLLVPRKKEEISCLEMVHDDHNVLFIWTDVGAFIVQLESMQFSEISKRMYCCDKLAFTSFYAPGTGIAGRHDGAGLLLNT